MKLTKNTILGFVGDSYYSKLIQLYNLIKYKKKGVTHIGIIADSRFNEDENNQKEFLVYEALDNGFVSSWYPEWWLMIRVNNGKIIPAKSKVKLSNVDIECEKLKGKPYGWFDIFRIGLSLFGIKLKLNTKNKLICSEAVARILYNCSNKKVNLSKEYDKSFDLISPIDVMDSGDIRKIK